MFEMTETKIIDGKVYRKGDPAPVGHEGRPYTKDTNQIPKAGEQRQEDAAPNRMMLPGKKRGRKPRVNTDGN